MTPECRDLIPDLTAFRSEARSWLRSVATSRVGGLDTAGEDSLAVFENWTESEEKDRTERARAWEALKFDAGWGSALSAPRHLGGRGLPMSYDLAFRQEEEGFVVPRRAEVFAVTQRLVVPTVLTWGSVGQQKDLLPSLLRADRLACQLFSEPDAGSDLAAVRTQAKLDGSAWHLSGQKVWTSGARVADLGLAICRTNASTDRHKCLTMFLVPMDASGVTVRPIRQMTGGSSFSEVLLENVQVPDGLRLGPVGQGWKVAMTTLGAERFDSSGLGTGSADRAVALASRIPELRATDRQEFARLFTYSAVQRYTADRVTASLSEGVEPGPEASIGKLLANRTMAQTSSCVAAVLGPHVVADGGPAETFAWSEHILGALGYRVAGGTEEIQKNILAERVLGLPR